MKMDFQTWLQDRHSAVILTSIENMVVPSYIFLWPLHILGRLSSGPCLPDQVRVLRG